MERVLRDDAEDADEDNEVELSDAWVPTQREIACSTTRAIAPMRRPTMIEELETELAMECVSKARPVCLGRGDGGGGDAEDGSPR